MSDDQCTATTQTGFGVVRCQLPTGHPEHHTNQQYRWYGGYPNSTTSPVPVCTDTIWVSDEIGTVACSLGQGHATDHVENTTGRALHWPLVDRCLAPDPEPVTDRATRHYSSSSNLAGASHDDLIRDLFRRVEQLEQLARPTASCESEELRQELRQLSQRVRGLEKAQVYGPGPHDLSALQASITNHVNRALTDLGSGLDARFTLMTQWGSGLTSLLTEQHRETERLLNRVVAQILGELKPVPPVFCEAPDNTGTLHCEKGPDHGGRHQSGNTSWPNPCRQPHPTLNVTCSTVKGHTTEHRSGPVRWVDGQGHVFVELGTVKDDGAQSERASGSPAAVRCPAQFREGQCLGYAGHDGECSALPDPREPQLEDPEEFAESTYDRTSDGTPMEEDDYPEQNFHS